MDLGINAKTQMLKTEMIELINSYKLPITLLDYVLSDILYEVKKQKEEIIAHEFNEFNSKQEIQEKEE